MCVRDSLEARRHGRDTIMYEHWLGYSISDPSKNSRTNGVYGAVALPAAPAPLPFVESPVPSVIYGAARPNNGRLALPIFPVSTAPASV